MNKPQNSSTSKPTKTNPPDTHPISNKQLIKASSYSALSGGSTLDCEIGSDAKKQVYTRITSNSVGGYFSTELIPMTDIERTLFSQPDTSRLTSVALQSLFKGKSVNTPALIMAALRNEGFIKPIGELKRFHQCINAKSFKALIKKLINNK
ncbi:MAG: hypothetical protein COB22_02190 [Cycloclasticus sp.]|nr:MAG: hypothetical protein COB22_02190 [Cycloclasticus sp.]